MLYIVPTYRVFKQCFLDYGRLYFYFGRKTNVNVYFSGNCWRCSQTLHFVGTGIANYNRVGKNSG